jgi:hypothetical protein
VVRVVQLFFFALVKDSCFGYPIQRATRNDFVSLPQSECPLTTRLLLLFVIRSDEMTTENSDGEVHVFAVDLDNNILFVKKLLPGQNLIIHKWDVPFDLRGMYMFVVNEAKENTKVYYPYLGCKHTLRTTREMAGRAITVQCIGDATISKLVETFWHFKESTNWDLLAFKEALKGIPKCVEEQVALAACFVNGRALEYIRAFGWKDEHGYLADREAVVRMAVNNNPFALEYANEKDQGDCSIVLDALSASSSEVHVMDVMEHVSSELKNRRDFVQTAVQICGGVLEYVNDEFRKDLTIACLSVGNDYTMLERVDDSLRGSFELALAAVKGNGFALQLLKERAWGNGYGPYTNNKEIVMEAVKSIGSRAFDHAGDAMRTCPEIEACLHEFNQSVYGGDPWV